MRIGPKYKLARRLGAPIFEKTQTQRYALSLSRKEKNDQMPTRPKSEFGKQLIEKQKARFSYGITERQFAKYVKLSLNSTEPTQKLFQFLESRLDNILYRAGFAKTRLQARQMAAHGHATVNGRRVTIPSISLKEGDTVGVREGSRASALFGEAGERIKAGAIPAWLTVSPENLEAKVVGKPVYVPNQAVFDLGQVIEFYSR
ncbi:30S ribosomal protein S4 [Candidatus Parcubacteria bacterium]|nr:30S ribosomal protein S4 [Candidatus Parcubacteria bacterium]